MALVYGLGLGIDQRGGHAAGFLGRTTNSGIRAHKVTGTWDGASNRFFESAFSCESLIMHARFATCGTKDSVRDAHPFTIKRDGRTVLHGVHNGVIYNADTSAKRNGRDYTVDSLELFHLLADGRTEEIQNLFGYGTIAYMRPGSEDTYLTRLTSSGDLEVALLKGGGVVFGSTQDIVLMGCELAGLHVRHFYKDTDPGRTYLVRPEGLFETEETGIKLSGGFRWGSSWYGNEDAWDWANTPRYRIAGDPASKDPTEEVYPLDSGTASRILSYLDGNENEPDAEEEEDYSDAVIEGPWDPRWERAMKKAING